MNKQNTIGLTMRTYKHIIRRTYTNTKQTKLADKEDIQTYTKPKKTLNLQIRRTSKHIQIQKCPWIKNTHGFGGGIKHPGYPRIKVV